MPPNAVFAARPQMRLNGQHAPALDQRLVELAIAHALNQPAQCRAVFSAGTVLAGGDLGAFGDVLQVDVGDLSVRLFTGAVDALGADFSDDGPPTSVVVAHDRLRSLDMSQRTRVFSEATDPDAISAVAGEAGLTAQFEIEGIEITHDAIVQANQTDLEFIRERARRLGADVWCEDGGLIVRSRGAWDASDALELNYGASLTRFSVLADLTTQASALELTGWNVAHKHTIDQQAEPNAALALNGGEIGADLLAETLGEQTRRIVHTAPASDEAALADARARVEAVAWRFIRGTGVALETPELAVGRVVDLDGLGERFDGLYYCVGVRHRFDTMAGYRVEFEVERADFVSGERRRPPSAHPGTRLPPKVKPTRGK
ncbi:MAG: phage late control D family protein [Anaerolineae bacterium]|nr:phage late control D family protein [Anaerolineae bacterium]